jgi:hypothetical protein
LSRAPGTIEIVPATLAHAEAIELRPGDRREIEALGLTPREGLVRCLARSVWADTYLADGEVAALTGLVLHPVVGGVAMPWLLTGRPVERHRKAFLRLTRARTQACCRSTVRSWPTSMRNTARRCAGSRGWASTSRRHGLWAPGARCSIKPS